jgi:hypothetical protein
MAPAAAIRSITVHTGPHGSETARSWSLLREEIDRQQVQRALCPACERVRRAAIAGVAGARGRRCTLARAQQRAERDATQALTALEALSPALQVAMRREEPPERVNHLRGQLAELLVRVQPLHRCALAPPD